MRRKAIIDARATNSALAGLPWWAKRLVVIIAIFILSAVVSTYTDSAGGGEGNKTSSSKKSSSGMSKSRSKNNASWLGTKALNFPGANQAINFPR
jgi:hypothetical protein